VSKSGPHRDPVGTIRRGENRHVHAIRWNESPDMGWRVIDIMSGGEWLESDATVRSWMVLYRPAPNERKRPGDD
jgi:hypothetical protein